MNPSSSSLKILHNKPDESLMPAHMMSPLCPPIEIRRSSRDTERHQSGDSGRARSDHCRRSGPGLCVSTDSSEHMVALGLLFGTQHKWGQSSERQPADRHLKGRTTTYLILFPWGLLLRIGLYAEGVGQGNLVVVTTVGRAF